MAQQKISELTSASTLAGTEKIVVNQSDVTKTATPAQIKTYVLTSGVSGTFTSPTSITVVNGIITAIS
jgi:hypothetical protein